MRDATSLLVTSVTCEELPAGIDEELRIVEIPAAFNPWITDALMAVTKDEISRVPELLGLLEGVVLLD